MKKLDKMAIAKILEGISSLLSLFPQKNNRTINLPTSPIYTSLKNDWEKIGSDMWQAYRTIESQQLEIKNYRSNNDRFKKYPKQCP